MEKLQTLLPKVTEKFWLPEFVGVPVPVKTTFCTPVAVKVPDEEKLTPLTVAVEIVYAPTVATLTCTKTVFVVVKATPCV